MNSLLIIAIVIIQLLIYYSNLSLNAQIPPSDGQKLAFFNDNVVEIITINTTNPTGDADLTVFDRLMSSPTKVFGLGESAHFFDEQQTFRNRLFIYGVINHGYRSLMLESGVLEGFIANEYIHNQLPNPDSSETIRKVLLEGFSHGFGDCDAVLVLVQWMRQWNINHPSAADKLYIFGLDLPLLGDATSVPLDIITPYLQRVDTLYTQSVQFLRLIELSNKASALLKRTEAAYKALGAHLIEPDYLDGFSTISYEQLTMSERAEFLSSIDTFYNYFDSRRSNYIGITNNAVEFEWNLHVTDMVRQMKLDLVTRTNLPRIAYWAETITLLQRVYGNSFNTLTINNSHAIINFTIPDQFVNQLNARSLSRERNLATNVKWVVDQGYTKVFLYMHNGHVGLSEGSVTIGDVVIPKYGDTPTGRYLKNWLGDTAYKVVSQTCDKFWANTGPRRIVTVDPGSGADIIPTSGCLNCTEIVFNKILRNGIPIETDRALYLDFNRVSISPTDSIRLWLKGDWDTRYSFIFQKFPLFDMFDGEVYIPTITNSLKIADIRYPASTRPPLAAANICSSFSHITVLFAIIVVIISLLL